MNIPHETFAAHLINNSGIA